ncbi:MAG: hypothetical protein LBC53_03260 [Spirochaetaceae bacterium]|jgi:two-component system phosphate regulon sensor histidine kinase PhoR|nr:hypothetical protein [Spirochaetaceae bacterium]
MNKNEKIHIYFSTTVILVISLIIVSLLLCVIFYMRFSRSSRAEIRYMAGVFYNAGAETLRDFFNGAGVFNENGEMTGEESFLDELRIVLIAPDGSIAFDSLASVMQNASKETPQSNHNDREEVIKARENGFGESKRFSQTLGKETWYYAVLRPDGMVLRVSKTNISVFFILFRILPVALCVVFVFLIISYAHLSHIWRMEKLRREFSANVSHELATPLTSIYGYAELLESGMAQKADKSIFIKKIKDETSRLITLIKDIMLLSQMDEGKTEEPFETVDAAAVAAEVIESLSAKAVKHDVSVSLQGSGVLILARKSMITELFHNLIDNAIKYNKPNGSVKVEISENGGSAVICVCDTGIGIPQEAQERVFERFYRADKSRSRKTGGTGLGLAIVKHIVMLHRGKIKLDSREDEGSRITVILKKQ